MSTVPDNELDLEKLFLPAWAQEESSSTKYAKYEVPEERGDRRGDRRGPRPPRREGFGGRRDENRPRGGGERRGEGRPGGARPPGAPGQRQPGQRFERREPRREAPPPLPEINAALVPDEKGVESLARQIKMTGRAYPLFDIAQMILQKPERHSVVFSVKKNPQGEPVQPLFVCALDDTLWLSEDEAVAHVLRKHFATFYQTERTPSEPPKGKYTFVAQCGISGVVLGPPNYHDYQNQLRKLHGERFSRMPFEAYKARVRIVKDEEVVKKWVEDQSWKTDFICLNLPEPLRLHSMEEVEKHFRETHKENIIKQVESYTLTGTAARNLRSPDLTRLVRSVWEDQKRFPLQIATVLSQQFAGHGLQFFKVNKTITHVSIARPHYLDLAAAPVSEGVRKIVDHINEHPKCTRKQLVEALAPTPARAPATPTTPPAPSEPQAPVAAEAQPAATETQQPQPEGQAPAPATAEAQPPRAPTPDPSQPTPEQTAVVSDLHWLIHQGHVIEFANGTLETAKKPLPKPPKPEKPAEQAAAGQPAAAPKETLAAQEGATGETKAAMPSEGAGETASPAERKPEVPVETSASGKTEAAPVGETPMGAAIGSPTEKPVSAGTPESSEPPPGNDANLSTASEASSEQQPPASQPAPEASQEAVESSASEAAEEKKELTAPTSPAS